MREKKFVKEQLQKVKKQKREVESKIKEDDGILRDRNGEVKCAIPFMECTRIGHPVPEAEPDGVKMCCTNPECPYAKHLVHQECFRSLEQNLLTLMAVKGYDKSVTEGVRINNDRLWIKKGLQLIQKNMRCACGKGQITRDNDAWEQREKKFGPPVEEKEKKHKPKAPKLPTLVTKAVPETNQKKLKQLDDHYLSSRSPPPPEETYLNNKYGPQFAMKAKKAAAPPLPAFPSFGNARASTTFGKVAAQSAAKPKQPVIKYPIGFAPIEPKPKRVEEEDYEDTVAHTVKENYGSKNNQWEEPPTRSTWKEPPPIPLPYYNAPKAYEISPKADETLFPHYHYSYNPNPNLKNALVQTDETNFPAALVKEPWLKLYSSKDSFDSGIRSGASGDTYSTWKEDSDSQNLGPASECYASGRSSVVQQYGYSEQQYGYSDQQYGHSEQQYGYSDQQYGHSNQQYGHSEQQYGYSESSSINERVKEEFTVVSFIFLDYGKFGVEVNESGRKKMLKNLFGNAWTPLFLSMAEKTIELGETAQYHQLDFPKHVVYDILKIIGKPFHEIRIDPRWGFKIVNNNGSNCFQLETTDGCRMIPEETVVAAFFKTMKARAETYLNDDVSEIYLTTNFKVTESQRNVFNKAAMKLNLGIKLFDQIDFQ